MRLNRQRATGYDHELGFKELLGSAAPVYKNVPGYPPISVVVMNGIPSPLGDCVIIKWVEGE
jgi:hypothetical protein